MKAEFRQVSENRKDYLDLLLLADEEERMIDRYLARGDMFALFDPDARAVCVVTKEGEGEYEIRNLAVAQAHQRRGYGSAMIAFLFDHYRGRCLRMTAGTGDSPMTIPFYQSCGFHEAYRVKNYMLDHYDRPIYENGRQLFDQVVFRKEFTEEP